MSVNIEAVERQLDRIQSFIPRIDTRMTGYFAIVSAQAALLFNAITPQDVSHWFNMVCLIAFLSCTVLALLNIYQCAHPSLRGNGQSLIFFAEIEKLDQDNFIKKLQIGKDTMTNAIDSIVANSSVQVPASASSVTNASKQKMDGEMFLQLLVAQLRAQDPSSPMDTNAMMTQTAQLASMEQLTAMSNLTQESFSLQMRMAASGLIGKEVGYVDSEGKQQTGIATSVSFADAVPTVAIGDKSIRLDAISGVATAS